MQAVGGNYLERTGPGSVVVHNTAPPVIPDPTHTGKAPLRGDYLT